MVLRLMALIMPKNILTIDAITIDVKAKTAVPGNVSIIISETLLFVI